VANHPLICSNAAAWVDRTSSAICSVTLTLSKNACVSVCCGHYTPANLRPTLHTEFKGTPDPLRGDEPFKRVRDAAKVQQHTFAQYNPLTLCW
jgi:hypothetical protein